MAADTIFTYVTEVVVADGFWTHDAYPHCSVYCAEQTRMALGLPEVEQDDPNESYAYIMPFSERETYTYPVCHACGATIGEDA